MNEVPVIAWGLYGTLLDNIPDTYESEARPNVDRVIGYFAKLGIRQVITTSDETDEGLSLLPWLEINDFIERVLGKEYISRAGGKIYEPVIRELGISAEQAVRSLIVVGHKPTDRPYDIPGVVFLNDRRRILSLPEEESTATITQHVIDILLAVGNGNFNRAFNDIFEEAEVTYNSRKKTRLWGGLNIDLFFMNFSGQPVEGPLGIPTIVLA